MNSLFFEDIKLQVVNGFFESLNAEKRGKSPSLSSIAKNLGYKSATSLKKVFPTIEDIHKYVCQDIAQQIDFRIKGVLSQAPSISKKNLVLTLMNTLINYFASNEALVRLYLERDVDFLESSTLISLSNTKVKLEMKLTDFFRQIGFENILNLASAYSIFILGLVTRLEQDFSTLKGSNRKINIESYNRNAENFVQITLGNGN